MNRLLKRGKLVWIVVVAMLVVGIAAPARGILAQGTDDDGIELVGVISAVAPGNFVVNGLTVLITGAEIKTPIQVGAQVKVEGRLQPNGQVLAREVYGMDDDDDDSHRLRAQEAQIVGLLRSFLGSTMVVNGQTIDVAAARLYGRLVPGELVWVHATWSPERAVWVGREAGPFVATRDVRDSLPNFDDDDYELVGTLTAIGDGNVVVSGLTIDTRRAEIKSRLVVGTLVKVHLFDDLDDATGRPLLVAREVELATESRLRQNVNLLTRSRSDNDNDDDRDDNGNSNSNDNDDRDDNGNFNGNDNDDGNNDNSSINDNDDDNGNDDNDNRGDDDNGNDNDDDDDDDDDD